MNEQDIAAANSDWLSRQPYLCTLASISWHFRRDYFCEGSLIHQSIASGVLLRLFSHLKTLCPTAAPALTINELMKDNCEGVPDKSGIYWILVPDGMTISFDKRIDDMHKFYPVEKLLRKYENCSEREILYIGKAEGTKGLRQRLKQYMKFGQGKGNIHRGGRAIWQIEHFGFLLVAYEVCENAEYREKQLLQEYKMRNGTYPLANWRG